VLEIILAAYESAATARSGLAALAAWADYLVQGTAPMLRKDRNLQVWLDCRETAVMFLAEAKPRLGKAEDEFDAAIAQCRIVADRLREVREVVPRIETTWAERRAFGSPDAAAVICRAGEAEAEALQGLQGVVAALP